MAKKKAAKKPKRTNKPGAGRPSTYGEATVSKTFRLPVSFVEILGDRPTERLVEIIRDSVQYRLRYGSGEIECE